MQFGLKAHVNQQIVDVLKKQSEIKSAILYGSRAMGNFRPGSDIDLTLTGESLPNSVVARVENEIDDLLLPYLFDISILSHIENPNVVDHIHRVGITFYQKETAIAPQNT